MRKPNSKVPGTTIKLFQLSLFPEFVIDEVVREKPINSIAGPARPRRRQPFEVRFEQAGGGYRSKFIYLKTS